MAPSKVVFTDRGQASRFRDKAQEFASAARAALDDGRADAAMLCAIHAAIAAADAVAIAKAGRRSADPDHMRSADLLEQIARSAPEIEAKSKQLRSLLQAKNVVEYEGRRATAREAQDAVARCERLVAWAVEQLH